MVLSKEEIPFQAAIITLSDKGYNNERVDESGPLAKKILEEYEEKLDNFLHDNLLFLGE
mgnify:CR=1 FL=1